MMIEIVRDKLVGEFGIQVIMTTHSPSTVAYANDEELFWMERGRPIRQSRRAEIIPILSDGLIVVTDEDAELRFSIALSEAQKTILCVEGITDKIILVEAWKRINGISALPFEVFDMFEADYIIHALARGKFFENYPNSKFIGLIDFDGAVGKAKAKFENNANWRRVGAERTNVVEYEHKRENAILTTLVVPDFRDRLANTTLEDPCLMIELMFRDEVVLNFCEKEPRAGGGEVLRPRKGKKRKFATEAIRELPNDAFSAFSPLFAHLIECCQRLDVGKA